MSKEKKNYTFEEILEVTDNELFMRAMQYYNFKGAVVKFYNTSLPEYENKTPYEVCEQKRGKELVRIFNMLEYGIK
jgi:hypothetical protein